MKTMKKPHVIIIGAGFCGLSAAFELSKENIQVTVLEKDDRIGGLASTFTVGSTQLEKFYHHWFKSDKDMIKLAKEINAYHRVIFKPTATAIYCSNRFFRLSNPLDILRFKPLRLVDRMRLGLLVPRIQAVKNWQKLEKQRAGEWLVKIIGEEAYDTIWNPLLRGKFGEFASEISAVWIWNKLKLRGGSRGGKGHEQLGYYIGGFGAFANRIKKCIEDRGGKIITKFPVEHLVVFESKVKGVRSGEQTIHADAVIATPPLPVTANLLEGHVSPLYIQYLRQIRYLGNICLVLELKHRLSNYYWINVSDLGFPFVGIIEHTNFQPVENYDGKHIVYLTKYLSPTNPRFSMTADDLLDRSIPYLQKIFPSFDPNWIQGYHLWKARYSQPVVECQYSRLKPATETPLEGFYVATMAQIYPEDRGTNYAIREGRVIGKRVGQELISRRY